MPDNEDKKRNLHTSITAEALQLARTKAAIEGGGIGDIIDSAIRQYCNKLARVIHGGARKNASKGSSTGAGK